MTKFSAIILPGDTKIRQLTPEGIAEYFNTAPSPGIWGFTFQGRSPQPLKIAEPEERTALFDALRLPQVTVLPVIKPNKEWLCLPVNRNQYVKSVKAKAPLPLLFAPENLSVFDPVKARVYKQRRVWLLYEDVNERFPIVQIEEMRSALDAFGMAPSHLSRELLEAFLSRELLEAFYLARASIEPPLQRVAKYALKLAGAEFERMEDLGAGQHRVTYRFEGRVDSVVVDGNLTVLDSGICLSGRDRDFDLTSIVFVKRHEEYEDEE